LAGIREKLKTGLLTALSKLPSDTIACIERFSDLKMISGRKHQGLSGFRLFTRRVKSVKQAKFRLPDIQPV
jgi:hypothetical protein